MDIGENAPLKNLPIHDQMYGKKEDSQMCYAFASAQDEKGQIWVDAKTYSRSVLKVMYAK